MSNIANIYGGGATHGEVSKPTVEAIKELLEMAESGEINGIAAAFTYRDNATASFIRGGNVNCVTLGALTRAQFSIVREFDDD